MPKSVCQRLACNLRGNRIAIHAEWLVTYPWYLMQPFCDDFDLRTLRKFEALLQPLLNAQWPGVERRISKDPAPQDWAPVAFPQYAAYCGLDKFVLSEIDTRSDEGLHSPQSSILLGALGDRRNYTMLVAMLDKGIGLDRMVEVIRAGDSFAVPAWVVMWLQCTIDGMNCFGTGFTNNIRSQAQVQSAVSSSPS